MDRRHGFRIVQSALRLLLYRVKRRRRRIKTTLTKGINPTSNLENPKTTATKTNYDKKRLFLFRLRGERPRVRFDTGNTRGTEIAFEATAHISRGGVGGVGDGGGALVVVRGGREPPRRRGRGNWQHHQNRRRRQYPVQGRLWRTRT